MVVFVYVYLEVVDFSMMFVCWIPLSQSGMVCDVYLGMGIWLWVVPLFASWFVISLLEVSLCALIFVLLC